MNRLQRLSKLETAAPARDRQVIRLVVDQGNDVGEAVASALQGLPSDPEPLVIVRVVV